MILKFSLIPLYTVNITGLNNMEIEKLIAVNITKMDLERLKITIKLSTT